MSCQHKKNVLSGSFLSYRRAAAICIAVFLFMAGAATEGDAQSSAGPVTLVFAGDVMLGAGVGDVVETTGQGDYTFPWAKVADYLRSADVAYVNLEAVISDKGKRYLGTFNYPWLRAAPRAVDGLVHAGIDIVSVANNHCFDYGEEALHDSLANLKTAGIEYAGAGSYEEAYGPTYVIAKGIKIAFLSFTDQIFPPMTASKAYTDALGIYHPANWGAAWLSNDMTAKGVARARAGGADLIVVCMHFGPQYTSGVLYNQKYHAEYALEQGADLVIGTGAHLVQAFELGDANRVIAYSLANFIFDQNADVVPGVDRGMVLEVVWENGSIRKVTPSYVHRDGETHQPEFEP